METLEQVPTPALVLDLDRLESNLAHMSERAEALGVSLRPHVKTHKCPEIARLQVEHGARGLTVSTLEEARVFADAGHRDLTWAFPVIPGRVDEAARLARRVRLGLVVDDARAAEALEGTGEELEVWLKVDCGYGRAGVDPRGKAFVDLASAVSRSPNLVYRGLLTHSGQGYAARGGDALAGVAEEERAVMAGAAGRLRDLGVEVPAVSVGSTPATSLARSLEGVDEVRPGNYALYDYTQAFLGSCDVSDCAATVLATVVSSRPGAAHCVVDAGALALSRDPGPADAEPASMGRILADAATGELDPERRLVSLSQEHGIVEGRLPYGTRVRIVPNHSCLAVACHDRFVVARGDRVLARWRIHRER